MVNNNYVNSILDSGANVSCNRFEFFKKLGIDAWKYKHENLDLNAVNKTNKCLGRCSVNMTIGLITIKVNLLTINNLHHNLIIGLDLFKPFSLSLTVNLKIFQKINFNDDIYIHLVQLAILNAYTKFHRNRLNGPILYGSTGSLFG